MQKIFLSTIGAVIVILTTSFYSTVEAKLKCWTNNEGVRECGDKVPPEYAQGGHQELNTTSGTVKKEVDRIRTKEELIERKRLGEIKAQQEKEAALQRREDEALLRTFNSIKDIEKARDDRIAAVESAIQLTELRNKSIHKRLDKTINLAAENEKSGERVDEALLKDIENLKQQIKSNQAIADKKMADIATIRKEHQLYIERFKKLKGITN